MNINSYIRLYIFLIDCFDRYVNVFNVKLKKVISRLILSMNIMIRLALFLALFHINIAAYGLGQTEATYASGDGTVINQVESDGTLVSNDRPNAGAFQQNPDGTAQGFQGFFFFELPTLAAGETITSASFSAYLDILANTESHLANLDVYFYGSNTLGAVADDYQQTTGVQGSGDNPDNWHGTRIVDNWITPNSTVDQDYSILDGLLLSELQSLYTGVTPNVTYAVFRMQVDWDSDNLPSGAAAARYRLDSHRGNGDPPSFLITTIPEAKICGLVVGIFILSYSLLKQTKRD